MTLDDAAAKARMVFGDALEQCYENGDQWALCLSFGDDMSVTFDQLSALADAFGTKDINLIYQEGRYYSSETGSDPSEFTVFVRKADRNKVTP